MPKIWKNSLKYRKNGKIQSKITKNDKNNKKTGKNRQK